MPPKNNEFPLILLIIFPLHLITILLSLALFILYLIDILINNKSLVDDKKILWVVLLFVGGFITMPFYWYMYVWKSPKHAAKKKS